MSKADGLYRTQTAQRHHRWQAAEVRGRSHDEQARLVVMGRLMRAPFITKKQRTLRS